MFVDIFTQVNCSGASNDHPHSADDRGSHQVSKSTNCGCRGDQDVRFLPGLDNVTYSWKPADGVHSSFLEILYSDSARKTGRSEKSNRLRVEGVPVVSCSLCQTVKRLEAKSGSGVPLETCSKWPAHSSLTLICDSRPYGSSGEVQTSKTKLGKNGGVLRWVLGRTWNSPGGIFAAATSKKFFVRFAEATMGRQKVTGSLDKSPSSMRTKAKRAILLDDVVGLTPKISWRGGCN